MWIVSFVNQLKTTNFWFKWHRKFPKFPSNWNLVLFHFLLGKTLPIWPEGFYVPLAFSIKVGPRWMTNSQSWIWDKGISQELAVGVPTGLFTYMRNASSLLFVWGVICIYIYIKLQSFPTGSSVCLRKETYLPPRKTTLCTHPKAFQNVEQKLLLSSHPYIIYIPICFIHLPREPVFSGLVKEAPSPEICDLIFQAQNLAMADGNKAGEAMACNSLANVSWQMHCGWVEYGYCIQ